MNHTVKSIGLTLVLSTAVYAAPAPDKVSDSFFDSYKAPEMVEEKFDDPEYLQVKKEWTKAGRKVASATNFGEGDLSADFKNLRKEWLAVTTAAQMEELLHRSQVKYATYSPDTKYFLAQMHLSLPLRGIVWRMRKLFENNKGSFGNKSTHVMAIQAVRGAVTGLRSFLPTKQTDAGIEFFTEPSVTMASSDQFQTMASFQQYLLGELLPAIAQAQRNIIALKGDIAKTNFVWDNKVVFGTGTFDDEVNRYVGNGPAELNFALATLSRAQHDILVYCSYNQEQAIKVAGEMGSHIGIDSAVFSPREEDVGITDEERIAILKKASSEKQFLHLRSNGPVSLKSAYTALKNSVIYSQRSYDYLQGQDASHTMALNPILFQADVGKNIDKGILNMKDVVSGPAEVRDPVTGKTVSLNLPAFYTNPPKSLTSLMATGFEAGANEKKIKNKKGETLEVRNYFSGRSIAWDNEAWKSYVPSASGKKANYMIEASRIIRYSLGTSTVFGLPGLFVK